MTVAEIIEKNKDGAKDIHIVLDGKEDPVDGTAPMYEEFYNGALADVPEKYHGLNIYNIGKILDSSNAKRTNAYRLIVSLFDIRVIDRLQYEKNDDNFKEMRKLLGINSDDPQAYRLRLLIADTIASITNKEYLSDINRLATSALCKQMFRDNEKVIDSIGFPNTEALNYIGEDPGG